MNLFYFSQGTDGEKVLRAATSGGAGFANRVVGTDLSGYIDPTLFSLNGTLSLGGIKYTRSVNPPTSPATGDLWDELAGDFIPWRYNGINWISRQIYQQFTSIVNNSSNTPIDLLLVNDILTVRYNINLITYAIAVRTGSTNTTASYWSLSLRRLTLDGTATLINTLDTSLAAPNAAINPKTLLNLFIDTTFVNTFSVQLTRIGTPSPLFASVGISFRWVR